MTEIEKVLVKFVTDIDEELSVTFEKDGYYFLSAENCINIDLTDFDDCGFIRHLKEFHNCNWADKFDLHLWSILHEIGHYETEDLLDEDTGEQEIRFWLSLTNKDISHNINIQNEYFNLTSEYYATDWAKDWIINHKEEANKISNLIKNARK